MALTAQKAARQLGSDQDRAQDLAEILRALAHPLRLRIVAILCDRDEEYVNTIAELLEIPQPIASQQLRILRANRLLSVERRDGKAFYRLAEPRLRQLVNCIHGCRMH